jgi:hypothetical protein
MSWCSGIMSEYAIALGTQHEKRKATLHIAQDILFLNIRFVLANNAKQAHKPGLYTQFRDRILSFP